MRQNYLTSLFILAFVIPLFANCSVFNSDDDIEAKNPLDHKPTQITGSSQDNSLDPSQVTPTAIEKSITNPTIPVSPTANSQPNHEEQEITDSSSSPASEHLPSIFPEAAVQILSPVNSSRVTSPIKLQASLIPGDSGRARIELLSDKGRLMYRKLLVFQNFSETPSLMEIEINFGINLPSEKATIVVSIDDTYGRMKAITSEEIVLQSSGENEINQAADHLASIIIQEPLSKSLVQGDTLTVSGLVMTSSTQPLLVELITTEGKIIGTRLAGISPGRIDEHRLFSTDVSFLVNYPTWVRVTVSEWNKWQTGPGQLASKEILLSP